MANFFWLGRLTYLPINVLCRYLTMYCLSFYVLLLPFLAAVSHFRFVSSLHWQPYAFFSDAMYAIKGDRVGSPL